MTKRKAKTPSNKAFPVWGWIVLAIALIAIAGTAIFMNSRPAAAALPPEITVARAAQERDQGAFVLDVRQPEEWVQLHIPGATLIPLGELPNRLSEVPKDSAVVVVCRTGNRSAQARDILKGAGFTNVTSMAGGVTGWQAQGLPIASGQ